MTNRRRLIALLLAGVACASLFSHVPRAQTGGAASHDHAVLLIDGEVWTAGDNWNGNLGVGSAGGPSRHYWTKVVPFGAGAVATGGEHTLAMMSDGSLYGWGLGTTGQLGVTPTASHTSPIAVPLSGITSISAGGNRSLAVGPGGVVYMFGFGTLGDGTTSKSVSTPTQVPGVTGAIQVAASSEHVLLLMSDGTVKAWGSNEYGQLGDGSTTNRLTPQAVPGLTDIVEVAVGASHSAALNTSGQVYTWGLNSSGAVGDGTTTNRLSPGLVTGLSSLTITQIASGGYHNLARASDGTVHAWGSNGAGQIAISTLTGYVTTPTFVTNLPNVITKVAAGTSNSFAFAADGRVWGWGSNGSGQLGNGTSGTQSTPALLAEAGGTGGNWIVGIPLFSGSNPNTYGQPQTVTITTATPGATVRYTTNGNTPTESDAVVPVGGVSIEQSLTIMARAFKTGSPPSPVKTGIWVLKVNTPNSAPPGTTYGSAVTVAVSTSSPGAAVHYTLDGSEPSQASPLYQTPLSFATRTTLKVKGFRAGWDPSSTSTQNYHFNYGKLAAPTLSPGEGTYNTDQTITMTAMSGAAIRYTTNGSTPSSSSTLYTAPVPVNATTTLKARAYHDDWVTSDTNTAIYTLEVGTPTFSLPSGAYAPGQIVAVSTTTPGATLRFTTNGAAPTATDAVVPATGTLVLGNFTLKVAGFKTGYSASNVASATYALTGDLTARRIAARYYWSIALSKDGLLSAFGWNGSGQLGDNTTTQRNVPVRVQGITGVVDVTAGQNHALAVLADGRVFAWGDGGNGRLGNNSTTQQRLPVLVAGLPPITRVAAGTSHSLAVSASGQVYAWGYNGAGRLGDGTTTDRHTPTLVPGLSDVVGVAAGDAYSLAWTSGGNVYAWGANNDGQLGDGSKTQRLSPVLISTLSGVTQLVTGDFHSMAVTSGGAVYAWGSNTYGQIGDNGALTDRTSPVLISALSNITTVGAGQQHSLAVTSTGAVYAWGRNLNNQIGDGTQTDRKIPVLLTGLSGIVRVTGGWTHSLALDEDGEIWVWGRGLYGQLGNGFSNADPGAIQPTPIPLDPGAVAAPSVSPVPGTYLNAQTVTLSATAGTTIRYTLDGSDPNAGSAIYTTPLTIGVTTTVKAKAFQNDWTPSVTTTAVYTIQEVATPVFTPPTGTYTSAQTITIATTTAGADLHYTLDGTEPTISSPTYAAPFEVSTGTTVKAKGFKAGFGDSPTATATYTFDYGPLPTPTASPTAGLFPTAVDVTLSGPAGATLRYTTDGTAPTPSSTIYTAPLTIAATTTLQARAFKTEWSPSAALVATYTIAGQPPTAVNDTATTNEDVPVAIPVTANDTDPESNQLTVTAVTQGTKGSVTINAPGGVTYTPSLNQTGADAFTYTIGDGHGNTAVGNVAVNVQPKNDAPVVTVQVTPVDGEAPLSVQFLADASDVDSPSLTYAWSFGDSQTSTTPVTVTHLYATPGTYVANLTVSDGAASVLRTTIVTVRPAGGGEAPPPNPTTTAPPTDSGVVTDFGGSTAFLYSGAAPVQRDVANGALDQTRVAVVRGRVFDQAGTPLPGARVSIAGQSAVGHTLSRADGMFDIAVNGGGVVVVRLEKDGYLPSQRRVETDWQDYSWMDNVRLVPLDPVFSTVQFHASASAPAQIARGTPVTDVDGTRQPTLIVPDGGSNATIHLPNGTVQPAVSQLNIRATEYTVGTSGTGREAMPGDLPATSAYTYALELTADEALAVGATNVTFSPALAFYVENFLNFPVGSPVPVGYYDRDRALWVPSDNGLIVKVLAIDPVTHLADLDIDGSGTAATPAALAALGVTEGERIKVGTLYAVNQSLWRVPIEHFTPYDCNWPYGPPSNAQPNNVPGPKDNPQKDKSCGEGKGSIIRCETQGLGELLGISGTPYTLNYLSTRQPGFTAGGSLDIALSESSISSSLKRIDVTVSVAGQQFKQAFTNPQPDMSLPFGWNGKDAYGRRVYGTQRATVKVEHVYDAVYYTPGAAFDRAFGVAGSSEIAGSRARSEVMLGQTFDRELSFDPPAASKLGGWTLSVQHVYDPKTRRLLRGDGTDETRDFKAYSATTVAGGGSTIPTPAGTPAKQADLPFVQSIAMAPNGSTVLSASQELYRLDADGLIRKLPNLPAGSSYPSSAGNQIAIDPQNRVLVGVSADIEPGGGGCSEGGYADGVAVWMFDGSAWSEVTTASTPDHVVGCGRPLVALGGDGTLYFTQGKYLYQFRPGDTSAALISQTEDLGYEGLTGVAVGPDGAVYISGTGFIDKITPSGLRTRVAGTGISGYSGDNGPATAAQVQAPAGLRVEADGTLYFLDQTFSVYAVESVRKISSQGVISTIAGGGDPTAPHNHADGTPIASVNIDFNAIALAPDGKIWALDAGAGGKLRTLGRDSNAGALSSSALQVVSTDGSEMYIFDQGRHMQTRHTLTNVILRTFEYDAENRLTGIVDTHGNRTTIERDANGTPLRIIAPFGQQTTLTFDQDGMLSSVTDPANETTELTYHAGGLLATFTTPESNTSTFTYDGFGRLISDQGPGGDIQTLTRTVVADGWSVSLAHNAGHARTWVTEQPESGEEVTRTIVPGVSTPTVSTTYPDGRLDVVYPQGMHVTMGRGADPRFAGDATFKNQVSTSTPSGLTTTTARTRSVVLANPDDLLSVQTLTIGTTTNGRTRTMLYDAAARTITSTSPEGRQVIKTFDAAGLPVRVERPGLLPITKSYNTLGQLTGIAVGTRTSTLTYDSGGRVASISYPLGGATTYGYDAVGRLTSITMPGPSGSRTLSSSFDGDGRMVGITPPGRPAYAATFSPAGLLASFTAPGGGTGTVAYRLDKRPETITRPGESPITIGYDAAGRVQQFVTPAGTVATAYDASTGLVSGITAPDATLAFAYDGVLPLETEWSGTVSGKVSRTWNVDFRVASHSVNDAHTVNFVYDDDGLITSVGALTLTRDGQTGLVTGTTIGSLAETISPNGYGDVQSYATTYGGAPLTAFSYSHDARGRIAQSTEVIGGVSHTFVYGYDAAGRLHQVTRDGTLVATYEYDPNGNRHTTTTSSGAISATFDDQDRLVSRGGATYTYTGSGYLQTRTDTAGATTYAYDAFGNLRSVTPASGPVVSYLVDGMQRRIARFVDGVRTHGWLYEGQLYPVAELNASNTVTARYVYGTRPTVPEYMIRGGATYRFVTDVRGSVRVVVNVNTGAIAQQLDYDAWGDVTADSNPGFQPFAFAGGLYDHHTRLYRFGARDYDGATGRWLTIDPGGFSGGANLYAYAHADPINFVDPTGDVPLLVPLLGALYGMTTNIAWQLAEGVPWSCLDKTDVLAAGAFGALGSVAPAVSILGSQFLGSAAVGAYLNSAQYLTAQTLNGQMTQWQGDDLGASIATGALGGAMTGAMDEMMDPARQAFQDMLPVEKFMNQAAEAESNFYGNMPKHKKLCPADGSNCPERP